MTDQELTTEAALIRLLDVIKPAFGDDYIGGADFINEVGEACRQEFANSLSHLQVAIAYKDGLLAFGGVPIFAKCKQQELIDEGWRLITMPVSVIDGRLFPTTNDLCGAAADALYRGKKCSFKVTEDNAVEVMREELALAHFDLPAAFDPILLDVMMAAIQDERDASQPACER